MRPLVWITPTNPNGPTLGWELYGNARLGGGVGGWETLPRPRQRSATEWVDSPPHTQTMTLVVTSIDQGHRVVEPEVALLRSYGKSDDRGAPPPLLLLSGPIELPAPWSLWALQDVTVVDEPPEIRNDDGKLVQQAMTISLLEWTGAAILLGPAAAARARAGK